MHAVVLAAGRGERLGVLTDHRSKVMLPIGPRLLIDWNLTELAAGRCAISDDRAWVRGATSSQPSGLGVPIRARA